MATFDHIAIDFLIPSPTNPRKKFGGDDWPDMVASVKQHGVMQPILVRPWPAGREGGTPDCYEIVAGERRYRASREAELAELPCMIRNLTDDQVLELQIIENLQRKDLTELEEADGFKLMIDHHGYTVERLMEKTSKSRSHIYNRLKLTELTPAARTLVEGGSIDASVALLIARIPGEKLQAKAIEEVTTTDYTGERMSFRRAKQHLLNRYTLHLNSAPFPTAEAVCGFESCESCHKRSGNAVEVFSDIESPHVCTDPDCFAQKRDAWHEAEAKRAEEQGKTVLRGKEGQQVIADTNRHDSGHLSLDAKCWNARNVETGKVPTYRELLGETTVTTTTVLHEGGLVEVATREVIRDAMIKAGLAKAAPELLPDKAAQAAAREKDARDRKVHDELLKRTRADIRQSLAATFERGEPMHIEDLRTIVIAFWTDILSYGDGEEIVELWWPDLDEDEHGDESMQARIQAMDAPDLTRLLFDMALWSIGYKTDTLNEVAHRHGIDTTKLKRTIERDLFPPTQKEAKKPKAAATAEQNQAHHTGWPAGTRVRVTKDARGPNGKRRKCCGREGTLTHQFRGPLMGFNTVLFDDGKHVTDLAWSELELVALPTAEPAAQAQEQTAAKGQESTAPTSSPTTEWPFPLLSEGGRDGSPTAEQAAQAQEEKPEQPDAGAAIDSSGSAAGGKGKTTRAASAVPYRDPANPVQTWSGRGKKPAWVQAHLDAGGSLEDLLARERCPHTADMLEGA